MKYKTGKTICSDCNNEAWLQTVETQFGGKVTYITCGNCDRHVCKDLKDKKTKKVIAEGCGHVDWTGELSECKCGRDIKLPTPGGMAI